MCLSICIIHFIILNINSYLEFISNTEQQYFLLNFKADPFSIMCVTNMVQCSVSQFECFSFSMKITRVVMKRQQTLFQFLCVTIILKRQVTYIYTCVCVCLCVNDMKTHFNRLHSLLKASAYSHSYARCVI